MTSTVTDGRIRVEVAYAKTAEQALLALQGEVGLTVRQVIERSGITRQFPEIDLTVNKVGIFGKLVGLDQPVESGDRVEIYRPLVADPKEARKKRAAVNRRSGTGPGRKED